MPEGFIVVEKQVEFGEVLEIIEVLEIVKVVKGHSEIIRINDFSRVMMGQ